MTKIQNSAFNLASHQLPAQLVENTHVRAAPQAMDSEGLEVESRLRLFWKLPTWELQPQGKEIEMQTLICCLFRVSASRSSQKYSEGQESGRPNYLVHLSLLCLFYDYHRARELTQEVTFLYCNRIKCFNSFDRTLSCFYSEMFSWQQKLPPVEAANELKSVRCIKETRI